jgi:hypothetical protein
MLRFMSDGASESSPKESIFRKTAKWLLEKFADQAFKILLAGGITLVGVFAFIARARKFFITYLWNLRFPSIFILLLLIPAAFGVYVFCCRFFRKPELNVTLPQSAIYFLRGHTLRPGNKIPSLTSLWHLREYL